MSEPSADERGLAGAIGNLDLPDAEVRRRLMALPAGQRFVQNDTWLALARDERLPVWRRLAAYRLLIERCLTYPCPREAFVRAALAPLGVDAGRMVDMTMAQALPVERRADTVIRMVHLPIATPIGPAAVYLALNPATDTVEQAGLSPTADWLDEP